MLFELRDERAGHLFHHPVSLFDGEGKEEADLEFEFLFLIVVVKLQNRHGWLRRKRGTIIPNLER